MFQHPFTLEKILDLGPEQIQFLLSRAKEIKKAYIQKKSSLPPQEGRKKSVLTFFKEPSTRTRLSFSQACHLLGVQCTHLEKDFSSLMKGEDLEQTFITFSQLGYDLCVFRTPVARELAPLLNFPPLSLINAGDGDHEHPTQALGDLFTFLELNLFQKGKKKFFLQDNLNPSGKNGLRGNCLES